MSELFKKIFFSKYEGKLLKTFKNNEMNIIYQIEVWFRNQFLANNGEIYYNLEKKYALPIGLDNTEFSFESFKERFNKGESKFALKYFISVILFIGIQIGRNREKVIQSKKTKQILSSKPSLTESLDVNLSYIRFDRVNKIDYSQDFSFLVGVPENVIFIIDKQLSSKIRLVGEGYGSFTNYGNGALFVTINELLNHLGEFTLIIKGKEITEVEDKTFILKSLLNTK